MIVQVLPADYDRSISNPVIRGGNHPRLSADMAITSRNVRLNNELEMVHRAYVLVGLCIHNWPKKGG